MRILITGGAGFIGGNFIHYQLTNHPEDHLVCVDALTYAGNIETLAGALENNRFTFLREDITNREGIFSIFEEYRPDVVAHFAAESHVDRSIEAPGVFLQTNVIGTQVLLDAARGFGVSRFHHVSTDEVYGDLPPDRPDLLFTEETPLRASSPYAASKASADLLTQAYCRTYHLPASISRCSNNYGPYQFPEKLIARMIVNALSGKPLPVYGKGDNVRDWLYVEDHCAAIDRIIRKGSAGEVYNIGGHMERTNLQVVRAIAERLGQGEIVYVADRPGHDLRYAVDAAKIRGALGWFAETSFDAGLEKTVDWYIQNRAWWEPILHGEYRTNNEKNAQNRNKSK